MATARPPGRGCGVLPRWLLGAALLLGLRLCMELYRAGSGLPGLRVPPELPRPHLLPAPDPPRGSRRRQVTYVRSGRRALPRSGGSTTPEPSCCAPRGLSRRKICGLGDIPNLTFEPPLCTLILYSIWIMQTNGDLWLPLDLFQGPRWHIELQPWAGPAQSLDEEASRFLSYISTTQIACNHMGTDSLATDSSPATKPWLVCLDDRFGLAHQIRSKRCRLYSLGLGNDDTDFEVSMANDGCEVHRFDPSVKSAHVLESQRLWHHRLSIDWRDPHPAVAAQKPRSNTRKLGSILNEFGHHKIDVLKADLESAEWKVLENLILEDVVEQIGQLIFEIHLHWPGFEVSGSESSVVRFWYSLLKELEQKDFRLFYTYKDLSKPQLFLKKDILNASSCYTLSWVNTRWK
ncbi:probable methyltransferase-like protein 24 isoform X2 [Chionomys nivalis]|uniref:probable methyltransferase-like protein 24 isoform X2 n=1 Tax=Chionomys nivalis TaxID=269649 RepID=UPI0025942FD3|nr:probable methyltransferase-like protein 24 isoform X2 [Chionomys nivalis]